MTKENLQSSKKHYEGLLEAIDFFSQKFNTEQLSFYATDFASKLLGINKLCLFTHEKGNYELIKQTDYSLESYVIENSEQLQHIATFYGSVMTTGFESYFEKKDIKALDMGFMFPLIIQDKLHGFLISTAEATKHITEEDISLARALMQIINSSLENSYNFVKLAEKKKKLDREVFNLFSINQSSRALLSVLDLNMLYQLSIDIFSEMTSSGVTSFGLYDEISRSVVVRGYKNVLMKKSVAASFELKNRKYSGYKIVFHKEKDIDLLKEIFVNYEDLDLLEAEYIVLVVKESILGFVTLGKTINETNYDESVFELIESLASATYVSFKNAIYFNEINYQKSIAEQKFNTLVKLNRLMKNLNSCESVNELCDLAASTIYIGFGIKKTLLALYDEKRVCHLKSLFGFAARSSVIEVNEALKTITPGGPIVEYFEKNMEVFLGKELTEDIGEGNCLVISPISMTLDSISEEEQILGYIMAFKTNDVLKEEEVLLLDTISNSIAPTIYHIKAKEKAIEEALKG